MEMSKEWKTYPGATRNELKKRKGIPFTEVNNIGAIAIADTEGNNDASVETYEPDKIPKGAYEGMKAIEIGARITEIVFMMYQHDCDNKKCNNGSKGWISRLVCYRIPIQLTKNQWTGNKFKLKYGSGKFVEGQIDGNTLTFTKLFSIGSMLTGYLHLNKRITLGREYPLEVLFVKSEEESAAGEEDDDENEDGDFGFHFLDFLGIRLKF